MRSLRNGSICDRAIQAITKDDIAGVINGLKRRNDIECLTSLTSSTYKLGIMNRAGKAIVGVLIGSYIGSGSALLLGAHSSGKLLIIPALVLAGWASFGHLVSLDDDMPGEWSNPEGSRKVWLTSVAGLGVKLALFAGALMLFFANDT